MRVVRWLWRELTRPRGHRRHRFYRGGRTSRGGVALIMAISSVMLLTVLVTEIAYDATQRMQMASQHRDEAKAAAIAGTGVQLYRLILMLSKQVGNNPMVAQYGAMLGINADSIWQMVPMFSTQLLRLVLSSGGGEVDDEEAAAMVAQGGLTDEQREASREEGTALRRNFLDFDGDFSASVQDENRRIYVGRFTATSLGDLLQTPAGMQIMALLSREDYQPWLRENNIIVEELIGNLADWTDADDIKLYQGGRESADYERLDPPYLPKNAPFDSYNEIRLVEGWHLDGVWERAGRNLTIYGDGKVNVNTAHQPVIRALLTAYFDGVPSESMIDLAMTEFMRLRGLPMAEGGLHFTNAKHFQTTMASLGAPLRDDVTEAVTTQSNVFRITSAGEVGDARVEVQAIMDFSEDPGGRILFWRSR